MDDIFTICFYKCNKSSWLSNTIKPFIYFEIWVEYDVHKKRHSPKQTAFHAEYLWGELNGDKALRIPYEWFLTIHKRLFAMHLKKDFMFLSMPIPGRATPFLEEINFNLHMACLSFFHSDYQTQEIAPKLMFLGTLFVSFLIDYFGSGMIVLWATNVSRIKHLTLAFHTGSLTGTEPLYLEIWESDRTFFRRHLARIGCGIHNRWFTTIAHGQHL